MSVFWMEVGVRRHRCTYYNRKRRVPSNFCSCGEKWGELFGGGATKYSKACKQQTCGPFDVLFEVWNLMGASKCDLSYGNSATKWDAAQTRRPRSESSARAFQERFHLRPLPGAKPADVENPFGLSSEPLKPRHQHLGGKLLKLLKLSLTRKPKSAAPPPPPPRVLDFQDLITQSTQLSTYESSDEVSSRASNSGSSEAESTRSHVSNSQLMANILISIMDEDDLKSEDATRQTMAGPHESAWHQPHLVDSPTLRTRQSATSSLKHSRGGPRSSAVAVDGLGLYTSPGPSRRYATLDLSKIDVHKLR